MPLSSRPAQREIMSNPDASLAARLRTLIAEWTREGLALSNGGQRKQEQGLAVSRCRNELAALLDAAPPSVKEIPEDFNQAGDVKGNCCSGCGGLYRFDTSVPSAVWNRVIRAQGLPEYLCAACILRAFARRGESFTAELSGDDFNGTLIEIQINGRSARDAQHVTEENTALRSAIALIVSQMEQAGAVAWAARLVKATELAYCVALTETPESHQGPDHD